MGTELLRFTLKPNALQSHQAAQTIIDEIYLKLSVTEPQHLIANRQSQQQQQLDALLSSSSSGLSKQPPPAEEVFCASPLAQSFLCLSIETQLSVIPQLQGTIPILSRSLNEGLSR